MTKKKLITAIFFLASALWLAPNSYAVYVDISGNASGSNSSVSVNSTVNSTSTSQNTSVIENHVVVESNGERKEYHGSDSNVNIQSSDGKNKVSINGNKSNSTVKPITPSSAIIIDSTNSASVAAEFSASAEAEVETLVKEIEAEQRGLIAHLLETLESLFSLFRN